MILAVYCRHWDQRGFEHEADVAIAKKDNFRRCLLVNKS